MKTSIEILSEGPRSFQPTLKKLIELLAKLDDCRDSDDDSEEEEVKQDAKKTNVPQKRPGSQNLPLDVIPDIKFRKTVVSQRSEVIEGGLDFEKDDSELGFARRVMFVLEAFFKDYLQHYTNHVWYELVYFRQHERVINGFYPPTRAILKTAIENPAVFLGGNKDKNEESTQEDLTILYNLHNECGRLINLFDWFTAFKTLVDPNGEQDQKLLQ